MNVVLKRLTELTGKLTWAAGVDPNTLAETRKMVAASLILEDPASRPVTTEPGVEPEIWEAAESGGALADRFAARAQRLRFVREEYLAINSAAEAPVRVFGPFIDSDCALIQFSFYASTDLVSVIATRSVGGFFEISETVLLVPQGTAAGDNAASFTLPPGTVWIRADFLAAGASGFAALRIAGGELTVNSATPVSEEPGAFVLPHGATWTLTVRPEQPPPSAPGGSDGDAVAVRLPATLRVHSGGSPVITGALEIQEFGKNLQFATPTGDAVATPEAVLFPYQPGGETWSISSSRSSLFDLRLDEAAAIVIAGWSIPIATTPVEKPEEAAHGGSAVVLMSGGPRSHITGVAGHTAWRITAVSANAYGIEIAGQAQSDSASIDFTLWGAVRSTAAMGGTTVSWLRHASRRGGADIVGIKHGRLVNSWDLPMEATGKPFEFDGTVSSLSLIAENDGLFRAHCVATVTAVPDKICGYALENLYLHVRPPRQIAFVGSGTSPWRLEDGHGRLVFDVRLAQPMLPDPYAANWQIEHLDVNEQGSALAVRLIWVDHERPWMQAELTRPISVPTPPRGDEGDPDHDRDLARRRFRSVTGGARDYLALIDLSSHRFGVAVRPHQDPVSVSAVIDDYNRMTLPLHEVHLMMQPQTHWEPVHVVPNVNAATNFDDWVPSTAHGGPTFVAAYRDRTVELVPVLPVSVGAEIMDLFLGEHRAAALFGLPFGLHAYVDMSLGDGRPVEGRFLVSAALHEHVFYQDPDNVFLAAAYLRLIALGDGVSTGPDDANRLMPGAMSQTSNFRKPNKNNFNSVLSNEVMTIVNDSFDTSVPLHQADLSGFGLSTFSKWRAPVFEENTGVTTVRFDVLVGRTSFEVIQLQSRLWAPQPRVVRTIILERTNSGIVHRFDSGWVAIENGDCTRYAPIATGVVEEYRNIRNIRILDKPLVHTGGGWIWQEVRYDADVVLSPDGAGGEGQVVPIRDHEGYVQIMPVDDPTKPPAVNAVNVPGPPQFAALMKRVGHPIGGGIDATIRLGGTLAMHLSHLEVALAGPAPEFVLAVSGAPTLPRAGQWTAVAIDGATKEVSSVDPRRGVPVIRRRFESDFVLRHAADAYAADATEHGFLMVTDAARVLFSSPWVNPSTPGTVMTQPPQVADPCALTHASSEFPGSSFALRCIEQAEFAVSPQDKWKLPAGPFTFTPPATGIAQGADWVIDREFDPSGRQITIDIDSINDARPWELKVEKPDMLRLNVDGFPKPMFLIESAFAALAGAAPGFDQPSVKLGPALQDVQEIINALKALIKIGFDVGVNVSAGHGPTPSFIVRLHLALRLPEEPNTRVDIGVGKFRGEFMVGGTLEAAPSGVSGGRLAVALRGDVQQGILPPALYAGGEFLFRVEVGDDGKAVVELGLGVVASLGGDLIKDLVELEVTISYGYTLIPETLQPGVMLGLQARAQLLAGMLGVSFGVQAMARIARLPAAVGDGVTIWAELRVAATVQVAVLIEETWEIHTQFEQELPLEAFAALAGVGLPFVAAAASL